METIKRDLQNIELEWTNFYDKARRMLARLARRSTQLDEADQKVAGETPAGPAPVPIAGAHTGRLSDRQKEIQQQILRRRAGG